MRRVEKGHYFEWDVGMRGVLPSLHLSPHLDVERSQPEDLGELHSKRREQLVQRAKHKNVVGIFKAQEKRDRMVR